MLNLTHEKSPGIYVVSFYQFWLQPGHKTESVARIKIRMASTAEQPRRTTSESSPRAPGVACDKTNEKKNAFFELKEFRKIRPK